jgi:VWFA-related protein
MSQLAMYLSGFSGRKNLVWFTAGEPPHIPTGLPNDPFPDISTYFDDARGTADILTLSRVALYPIDARGLVTNARVSVQILLQDGALADLAASTGGRAFYSTNGFKQAIAEVVSTGSNYYTLAYNPTNQRWDGSFRKIKVKLANNALANGAAQTSAPLVPPFHLEYRNGYFAQQLAPSAPHTSTSASTHKLISYSPKGDPNGPGAAMASPLRRAMTFGSIGPFRSSSAPRSCPLLTR